MTARQVVTVHHFGPTRIEVDPEGSWVGIKMVAVETGDSSQAKMTPGVARELAAALLSVATAVEKGAGR